MSAIADTISGASTTSTRSTSLRMVSSMSSIWPSRTCSRTLQPGRGLQFRYQGPEHWHFPAAKYARIFHGKLPANAGACNSVATLQHSLQRYVVGQRDIHHTAQSIELQSHSVSPAPSLERQTRVYSIQTGSQPVFRLTSSLSIQENAAARSCSPMTERPTYDGLTIEFRRRFAKGLLVQSSYTFAKALSNMYASNSDLFDQPATLREGLDIRRGVTPFDITQAFKTNFIYELPVGRGQHFFGGANGWVDKLVGGWGFNGNIRIQSGSPFSLGNVQLVGMTAKDLQKAIGVYRNQADADGVNRGNVWVLPLDIRQNTFRAFNTAFASRHQPADLHAGSTDGPLHRPGGSRLLAGYCGPMRLQQPGSQRTSVLPF